MPDGERSIMEVVRENIIRYRKEKEMTKSELCEKANYSRETYYKFESGETGISLPTIQRFAYALGVKTIDLVEDWT